MPIKDVQTTNKQHAVPQNIMDVEFKIIGELTLRQFAYLIVFGGVAYISAVYMQGIFRWPVTVICALLGFGLAFVPLQERGLDQWIVNFFLAVYTPNQKIWKKDVIAPAVFLYQNMAVVKQELITLAPTSSRRKLEEFLEHSDLEKKEDRLDIPEKKYIQMAKDAYAGVVPTKASVGVSPAFAPPLVEEYTPPVVPFAPPVPSAPEPVEKPQPTPVIKEEKKEEKIETLTPVPAPKEQVEKVYKPVEVKPIDEVKPTEVKHEVEQPDLIKKSALAPQVVTSPVEKPQIPEQPDLKFPGKRESDITLAPLTPDRHSGRKFTSLLPKQGELILPIRGERRIKTSDEANIDKDIQEKTDQLNLLINQIKGSSSFKKPSEQPKPATPPQPVHYEVKLESKPEPKPLPHPVSPQVSHTITIPESTVPEPPKAVPAPRVDNSILQSEIKSLKDELERSQKEKERVHSGSPLNNPDKPGERPVYISMTPLTNKPNVVSGVVLNTLGVGLQNTIVIVKNDRNETIRAVKTNSLGLFTFITPLANGLYKIIVDEFHKSGAFFDIISLQVKGDVIPPIEFRGR